MRELTGGFSCIIGASASDYAGGSAGRTTGSSRVAARTWRSTKSTRALAPRSGANVVLTRLGLSASENPVGVQHMVIWNLYLRFQRMVYNFIAILQEFNGIKTEQ